MRQIGAFDAKTRLGQLLDAVEAGEEILITRRGKPVARLVSPGAEFNPDRGRRAAQQIRLLRAGQSLGGVAIKTLIDEGRR